MAKLTAAEKELFSCAADLFVEYNVRVVSIKHLGLTIGIQSTCQHNNSHVRVYVTQCGMNDKFKFKRGVLELLTKYENDNYIVVPLWGRTFGEMVDVVVDMYSGGMDGVNGADCRSL